MTTDQRNCHGNALGVGMATLFLVVAFLFVAGGYSVTSKAQIPPEGMEMVRGHTAMGIPSGTDLAESPTLTHTAVCNTNGTTFASDNGDRVS